MRSGSEPRAALALALASALALMAGGCIRANVQDKDSGSAGSGGSGGAGGATGGSAGGATGATGGASGGSIGGAGVGGAIAGNGGSSGSGGGSGGSAGGGSGGSAGGGSGGSAGGGSAGRGGSGGSGTGGTAGASGRGGSGGSGGNGGVSGNGGRGGAGGSGTGGAGGTGLAGVMPALAGQIVITELLHDVPGNDDMAEWFEIYNPSTTVTYDLMGCDVGDFNTYVPVANPLVLPPGAFRTLGIVEDVGFKVDYVYGSSIKFDSQGADSARIRCGSVLIDEFAYNSTDAVDANSVGHTFSVDPDHYSASDNDIRANWCLGTTPYMMGAVTLYGTPGAANPQCP